MPTHSPDRDRAACAALLATGSFSFHAASRLLPADIRDDATALYAFCRLADDAVDLATDKAAGVAMLTTRLDAIYRGSAIDNPVDRAFAAMVMRHGIPRSLPDALIEGLAWDAEGRRYATLAELRAYAARVAGTVGVMMAMLMGARDAESLAAACDLGLAMQLTNIARDVGEDARAQRLYLPLEWLDAAGVDAGRLLAAPSFSPALGTVVTRLLDEAETLYDVAARGIGRLPFRCRPGIAAALRIYRAIGRGLAAKNCDSVSVRARVSGPRKLGLAALSFTDTVLPRSLYAVEPCAEVGFLIDAVALPRGEPAGAGVRLILLIDRLERIDRAVIRGAALSGNFA